MIEGRLQRNPKWWVCGWTTRRCVIWLKADIKENPKWWVCGECTRLRVRVADRVLLLCMSGAFWSVLSLFVSFCRLLSIFLDFGFTGGFDTFLALSALFWPKNLFSGFGQFSHFGF